MQCPIVQITYLAYGWLLRPLATDSFCDDPSARSSEEDVVLANEKKSYEDLQYFFFGFPQDVLTPNFDIGGILE